MELPIELLDTINLLKITTTSIKEIYERLQALEESNKKDTPLYKEVLNTLNLYLEQEKELYGKIKDDSNIIFGVIGVLFEKKKSPSFTLSIAPEIDLSLENNTENLVLRRIFNNLITKLLNIPEMHIMYIHQNSEKLDDDDNKFYYVSSSLKFDFLNTFITLIDSYLYNSQNKYINIKSDLLKVKYNFSFLNKDIESLLCENEFNVPEKLYWESKGFQDFYGMSSLDYAFVVLYVLEGATEKEFNNLFNNFCDPYDYFVLKDYPKFFRYVFAQIFLRCSNLFYKEDRMSNLNSPLNKKIYEEVLAHEDEDNDLVNKIRVNVKKK